MFRREVDTVQERVRETLKNARKQAGMTQQQMADRLGLTLGHYQKIEYNKLNGSFAVWDALEDILGIHQQKLRIYYEQYFRKNRGNVVCWAPTSIGRCLLHDCERGPLRQVCKDFERMEGKR